jgi:hypothetical protein
MDDEAGNGFWYSLRFTMQPGRQESDHFERLLSFCESARIDDVMFLINGEELNQGHLTLEETGPWMDMIARGKALLDPLGITTSINPWPTLLHCDRGRTLRDGQKFTLMADPHGNTATAVACPICPEWRGYIADIYSRYAQVHPEMLWVEDDFRLHNHLPLIWGGCFCELHMREYSKRAGRKISREEFVAGVLKPGVPHPYRGIWLDTARDAMVRNAEIIGNAVHRISPAARVGLMSSCPHVHCAEGREWRGILTGLSAGNPMVSRPTLPAYTEVSPQQYLQGFVAYSVLTANVVPPDTQIYPELENYPYSGFSKSKAFTGFQLASSLAAGADGITLNLFDMMGNGILMREGYQKVLSESKEFLSGMKELGMKPNRQKGVQVLVGASSSRTLHVGSGRGMEGLYPDETFWASLLSVMGISCAYCVDGDPEGKVLAVSGQYFRNMDESGLRRLFGQNFVMMDGEAAHTLIDMGFGGLAGMSDAVWHPMESGFQSYEQVCDGIAYAGVEEARVSSQVGVGDYLEIRYDAGISHSADLKLISEVKHPDGRKAGAGTALYDGRVLVLPYGRTGSMQGHLTPVRQAVLQSVIAGIDSRYEKPAYVAGQPNILLCRYDLGNRQAVLLANFSHDAYDELDLYLPDAQETDFLEACVDNPVPHMAPTSRNGQHIVLGSGLGALSVKVLTY